MSKTLEGNFRFLSSPQTLLKTASLELALICWRHKFHKIRIWTDRSVHTPEFNINDVLNVYLPNHIPKIINRYIRIIGSELIAWIDFHKWRIFHCVRTWEILKCLNCVVFRSDGRICYRNTAKNLLASDRLNFEEKFRIACVYCFKGGIDLLWPFVMDKVDTSLCSDNVVNENPSNEALRFAATKYWSDIKRNKHLVGPDLLQCKDMYPLAQMQFYWNMRIGLRSLRFLFVRGICDRGDANSHDVMKYLIPNLNTAQQKHLLTLKPLALLHLLTYQEVESCDCSLQVWKYLKDFVTNDEFFRLLRFVWSLAFGLWYKHHYMAIILREIWITAPKHFRDDILNNHFSIFFDELRVPSDLRTNGLDMGFYIDLLDNLNSDHRSKLWHENWWKFICLGTIPDLYKLMKLCLADNNAIASFKTQSMANYLAQKKNFMLFIEAGLYKELSNYLKFSCSDITQVLETQQQILSSLQSDSFFSIRSKSDFSLDRCIKLNDFINGSYFSMFSADQFKSEIIQSNFKSLKPRLIKSDCLDEFRNLTTCLASCYNINEVKQAAYKICLEVLMRDDLLVDFNLHQWKRFLKWCAPWEEFLQLKKRYIWLDC